MKHIYVLLLSVLILSGGSHKTDDYDFLVMNDTLPIESPEILNEDIVEVKDSLIEIDEKVRAIESTIVPTKKSDMENNETEPSKPVNTPTPTVVPTNTPEIVSTPVLTVIPAATPKSVVTVEPTAESTPEVVVTPEPTVAPTPEPTPIPTLVPTPVPTPVSTPEPPQQVCPGGYNPDWDCGVRIDKAEAFKLFSAADYGSVEAAFAACDVDGQSTLEFHGVEVRSYGCSQQTRNDYGVWGFAIYYMDENGNIIY